MSKVDAQRALRDARYAAYQARREAAGAAVTPAPAARPRASVPAVAPEATEQVGQQVTGGLAPEPPAEVVEAAAPAGVAERLCGHRSISNKTCIRPAGHEQKSHRYS